MDTDGGRRSISLILFIITGLILILASKFYIMKVYIISNSQLNKLLSIKLKEEGYEIINKSKGVYMIQPVLYERKWG